MHNNYQNANLFL